MSSRRKARRRFLESLSLSERQSTHEGPEAPVGSIRAWACPWLWGPSASCNERRANQWAQPRSYPIPGRPPRRHRERQCLQCGSMMRREQAWH